MTEAEIIAKAQQSIVLPLSSAGERTFQCTLGEQYFAFRSYYVKGFQDLWYLDVMTGDQEPLAMGRRIIPGSINIFKGFANVLGELAAVVILNDGFSVSDPDELGGELWVAWYPNAADNPFQDGDPMETLIDNINQGFIDE